MLSNAAGRASASGPYLRGALRYCTVADVHTASEK